jgi:uncharacterized protein (DUF58 family)
MSSAPLLQGLLELGFLLGVIFAPILFLIWYFSDRKISTPQWALLTGIMLMAGLFMRLVVIAALAALVLVAIGTAWVWHRVILTDLRYQRSFDRSHVFPGDQAEVTWTIANDKPLPISWLRWREALPVFPFGSTTIEGLRFESVAIKSNYASKAEELDEVTALRGYETIVRSSKVTALRRGYYRFGPTNWQASDALGLYTAESQVRDPSALTVYPAIVRADHFQFQIKALLGDIRRRNSLVEDPIWYRGSREYRSADPMRTIDWKASARTAVLQVKTFEPTVHAKLMILVNLHSFEHITTGWVTEYMESVISVAASIATWALESGFEVGVHSNGALPDSHVPFKLLPSSGDAQLFTILDYLAKIMLIVHRRVEDMLLDLDDLPHGTAVVICSNVVTQGLMNALTSQTRRRDVTLLLVDNDVEFTIPGVDVIHATSHSLQAA